MILIQDKIVSRDVVEEQFLCNLDACKGVCCIEGEGGAPLEENEAALIPEIYEKVEPYMTEEGIKEVGLQGYHTPNEDGIPATPLIKGRACAYLNYDEKGIAKCAFETAYEEGKIEWQKPVSCHLYPIRIKDYSDFSAINYSRWDICSAACTHGAKHKLPLYQFVKDALIRKYGEEFYEELDAIAQYMANPIEEKE